MKAILLLLNLSVLLSSIHSQKTVIYQEDFNDNKNTWWLNSNQYASTSIEKGKYLFEKKEAGNYITWQNISTAISPSEKYKIEVKIKLSNADVNGYYAVAWDIKDANNYYAFCVYARGGFEFYKHVNGQYISLHKYAQPMEIKKKSGEQEYKIEITLAKGSAGFDVNGVWLSGNKYDGHLTSNLGFSLYQPQKIEVDYVKIYQDKPVVINTSTDKDDLYPVFKDINEKVFNTPDASKYVYAGCAEGNCNDGEGTFIAVKADGYGSGGEYDEFTHLEYSVLKGKFSDNGSKCVGDNYYKYFKVGKKRKNSRWQFPENSKFDRPEKNMWHIYSGELTKALLYGEKEASYYFANGNGSFVQAENSIIESYNGLFFYNLPLYVNIKYKKNQPLSSFSGYINSQLLPVVGTAVYPDGDVYTGTFQNYKIYGVGKLTSKGVTKTGFWEDGKLLQAQEMFIPDTALLRNLYQSQRWSNEVGIAYHPVYYNQNYAAAIKGRFVGEDGKDKDASYTGNGIFVENSDNVYFGMFKNGKPEGPGFYNGGVTQMIFGLFEKGMFMTGAELISVSTNRYNEYVPKLKWLKMYPENDDLIKGWQLMKAGKKQEAITAFTNAANYGNYEAMYQLAEIYSTGNQPPANILLAARWHEKSAASGEYKHVFALANAYENYVAVKDAKKAAETYKQAALLADKEAVRNCINKYYQLKYPYLLLEDYQYYSLDDEAKMLKEADYKTMVAARTKNRLAQAEQQRLKSRPLFVMKEIIIGGGSCTISDGNRIIKAARTGEQEVKTGDYIFTGKTFSYVTNVDPWGHASTSAGSVSLREQPFVVKDYNLKPYMEKTSCYSCNGSGGTKGGTLTGGGFITGHTTTITPTIVSGVSKVTTTPTYGPPMSIYIPGKPCKVCNGSGSLGEYEATKVISR